MLIVDSPPWLKCVPGERWKPSGHGQLTNRVADATLSGADNVEPKSVVAVVSLRRTLYFLENIGVLSSCWEVSRRNSPCHPESATAPRCCRRRPTSRKASHARGNYAIPRRLNADRTDLGANTDHVTPTDADR
jgi:hypothetical protein